MRKVRKYVSTEVRESPSLRRSPRDLRRGEACLARLSVGGGEVGRARGSRRGSPRRRTSCRCCRDAATSVARVRRAPIASPDAVADRRSRPRRPRGGAGVRSGGRSLPSRIGRRRANRPKGAKDWGRLGKSGRGGPSSRRRHDLPAATLVSASGAFGRPDRRRTGRRGDVVLPTFLHAVAVQMGGRTAGGGGSATGSRRSFDLTFRPFVPKLDAYQTTEVLIAAEVGP